MQFDLEKFKSIYRDEFNEDLSDEDAERKARMLLNLYLSVYTSVVDVVHEVQLTESNNEEVQEAARTLSGSIPSS
jgi:hypothetical protein